MKATQPLRDKGQSLWLDSTTRDAPCRSRRLERIGPGIRYHWFCCGAIQATVRLLSA
jgi:hypothetical protein